MSKKNAINIDKLDKNIPNIKNLISFAEDILTILKTGNIEPILYGSLAYFYYTNNETQINDLDFYIHESEFKQLLEIFKLNAIEHKYSKKYHTVQIKKEIENQTLILEFDSINYWFSDEFTTRRIELKNMDIRILSKESLTKIYDIAVKESKTKEKLEGYKIKLANLEKVKL